jgi:hypothetical protein
MSQHLSSYASFLHSVQHPTSCPAGLNFSDDGIAQTHVCTMLHGTSPTRARQILKTVSQQSPNPTDLPRHRDIPHPLPCRSKVENGTSPAPELLYRATMIYHVVHGGLCLNHQQRTPHIEPNPARHDQTLHYQSQAFAAQALGIPHNRSRLTIPLGEACVQPQPQRSSIPRKNESHS